MIEVPHAEGTDEATVYRLVDRVRKLIRRFGPTSPTLHEMHARYPTLLTGVSPATLEPLEAEVLRLEKLDDEKVVQHQGGGC